ncbi:hypothetical protein [Hymenobacter bucti]|uniref:DNA helicase n=1 Tax=Hymenobacter bucti TaxID=1844114 RepID=A0ABW4QY66_9BACT
MPVNIILKGQQDTDEYKAGLKLKGIFENSIPQKAEGDILIVSNVTLFGQEVKDIDIVVTAKVKGLWNKLKFRPKGEFSYVDEGVTFWSFCFVIELKKHRATEVKIGTMNNVLVSYNGKLHDATYQNEKQKYSLVRYFKNIDEVKKNVFISNFIWLSNVDSKELIIIKKPGEHNILPSDFSMQWLLMLLLSQNKPYKKIKNGNAYWNCNSFLNDELSIDDFKKAFDLFENVKKNVGKITRQHFERISKRILKEQKYAEAILDNSDKGGKFVIIQGKAGTGKTVKILNIACDLCINYGHRCLILTYNFTLVADIKRTLTLAHIPDGIGRESVGIMTLFKFFIDLFEAFGIYSGENMLDDAAFFAHYPKYCQELSEFIKANKQNYTEVEDFMQQNHQLISWDYILIDEAQDWNPFEVDILYSIFGPSRIVIAQAPDQKVRGSNNPYWIKPKWRLHKDFEQTNEKKSFRQKSNLVGFVNQFAEKVGLSWELEPNELFTGGRVIITSKYDIDLHNELYEDCLSSGNKAYEMLFLVPPSRIVTDGTEEIKFKKHKDDKEFFTKLIKVRHCNLVDEFSGKIDFWDGTNKELRRNYPVKIDQHRLIQYESCRGLEGWTVVCIELDELIKYLDNKYQDDEVANELALDSLEERRNRYTYMWTLIPLTRAIDTLVITLKDKNSPIAKKLYELYKHNSDFVEWR